MKKEFFILSLFLLLNSNLQSLSAQNTSFESDSIATINLDQVVVQSNLKTSINNTTTTIDKSLIKTAKSVPQVLQNQTSIVMLAEGGSGVGNTSLRIRGVDATRINVSLNGMSLNNPESQEVYWVNLPDITNSLQKITVNRGIGSSNTGTSSLGGSIALHTEGGKPSSYGETFTSLGSYDTYSLSVAGGTGLLKNNLSIDGRYSKTKSDGYIRNGKVDHKTAYVALSHYKERQMIRINYINGVQHTGITWEGVSPEEMKKNRRYNPAGQYTDDKGNIQYYNNETDNYYSNIVQFLYLNTFQNDLKINISSSYNNGYGYYENYKQNQNLYKKYHIKPQIIDKIEHKNSDVITKKLMSNNNYTLNSNIEYFKENLFLSGVLYGSIYNGDHYGRLKWVKYNQNIPKNYEWYRNSSNKNEFNIVSKASYALIRNLSIIGDLQYRYVYYKMKGLDSDFSDIKNHQNYNFWNPKIGFTFSEKSNEAYISMAIANREPLRADLKESIKGGNKNIIQPERLFDYELGYNYLRKRFSISANLYYMYYKDQMVQTGRLNDVGYKLMENVPKSYRTGIELSGSYMANKLIKLDANMTISRNKIKNHTTYYDLYDNDINWNLIGQRSEYIGTSQLAFSPNIIGGASTTLSPYKTLNITFTGKYVGKQNYDNTNNKNNRLDDYFTANFIADYTLTIKNKTNLNFQFVINNLLNKHYIANAWVATDKFENGKEIVYKGYYPQATRNIMFKANLNF